MTPDISEPERKAAFWRELIPCPDYQNVGEFSRNARTCDTDFVLTGKGRRHVRQFQ